MNVGFHAVPADLGSGDRGAGGVRVAEARLLILVPTVTAGLDDIVL